MCMLFIFFINSTCQKKISANQLLRLCYVPKILIQYGYVLFFFDCHTFGPKLAMSYVLP